jgi:hypothetical protein
LHLFPLFVDSLLFIQKVQIQLNAGFHHNFFFLFVTPDPTIFGHGPYVSTSTCDPDFVAVNC